MKTKDGVSSFAKNQLEKYGWKEGDGIGKTNQGISDPIKASYKFDNSGVGFNLSDEFTVNWWEHLFNSTANKISEPSKKDTPVLKQEQAETDEKKGFLNKKSYFYSRFQKGSLLVNGELINTKPEAPVEVKKEEEEPKKIDRVSDEDLLNICQGRTAHKGARHGIKMNGKLARIQEQEKILSQKIKHKLEETVLPEEDNNDEETKSSKKKKKHKKHKKEEESCE